MRIMVRGLGGVLARPTLAQSCELLHSRIDRERASHTLEVFAVSTDGIMVGISTLKSGLAVCTAKITTVAPSTSSNVKDLVQLSTCGTK